MCFFSVDAPFSFPLPDCHPLQSHLSLPPARLPSALLCGPFHSELLCFFLFFLPTSAHENLTPKLSVSALHTLGWVMSRNLVGWFQQLPWLGRRGLDGLFNPLITILDFAWEKKLQQAEELASSWPGSRNLPTSQKLRKQQRKKKKAVGGGGAKRKERKGIKSRRERPNFWAITAHWGQSSNY